jgi:hypothetical protein
MSLSIEKKILWDGAASESILDGGDSISICNISWYLQHTPLLHWWSNGLVPRFSTLYVQTVIYIYYIWLYLSIGNVWLMYLHVANSPNVYMLGDIWQPEHGLTVNDACSREWSQDELILCLGIIWLSIFPDVSRYIPVLWLLVPQKTHNYFGWW